MVGLIGKLIYVAIFYSKSQITIDPGISKHLVELTLTPLASHTQLTVEFEFFLEPLDVLAPLDLRIRAFEPASRQISPAVMSFVIVVFLM